jgi:co-chaperonin GroES (HSP10)
MLTPIGKRILLIPVEVKAGTLLMPNAKPNQFNVVAIGDEVTKVKVGDIIYLEKHYGTEIQHQGEKYLVIEEGSILAKLD